ncbi:MAG TPA: endonuclease/exonuclease/phosphatase family protein [Woeseiaceae bacterium]|nr:endonuclease/exonuclease/phosphatase family protein [Woeseiaceae bacterium]
MPQLLVITALALLACSNAAQAEEAALDLRVMTFNIEWGGTHVSFDNVVAAIRRSGADIVGIQEAEGNLARLAEELGWYFDLQNYAISRYPLINPAAANGQYVFAEIRPGEVIALLNVHLPSDPYGPDLVRDGAAPDEVLATERRVRLPKMLPYLDTARQLIADGMPIFLTGDFNSPAHTDWTATMVDARPFLRYPVQWPLTKALQDAGLRDSWRSAYPSVADHPGLTWWAGRPPLESYAPGANDPEDRIDFIWFAGPAEILGSELIGEPGTPNARVTVTPWPSDHRAVVSDFKVVPARMPPLLATVQRVYTQGDTIEIIYRNVDSSELQIEREDDNAPAHAAGRLSVAGDGHANIDGSKLQAGQYIVSLPQAGDTVLEARFWILEKNARPFVRIAGTSLKVGERISIAWGNAPGNRNDYLGIVAQEIESGYDAAATWAYVNAKPSGNISIEARTAEGRWPVPPGRYVVRLCKDDGYEVLAESEAFVIQ